ncbi:MAG: trehalase family glycosidase [bacterium]|nr:trehalase family glycosidase [bacterium]
MYPDVWAQGGIFSFSGLDGPTEFQRNFMALTMTEKIGLKFISLSWPSGDEAYFYFDIDIAGIEKDRNTICAHDIIDVDTDIGRVSFVAVDYRTVMARAPENAITVVNVPGDYRIIKGEDEHTVSMSDDEALNIAARQCNGRREFVIRYGDAGDACCEDLWPDMDEIMAERRRYYETKDCSAALTSTARACMARAYGILKANVYAPEGLLEGCWTTPDRWPHKFMWLWDSVFHSLANVEIDHKLAQDTLKSVLALQREDGFIAIAADCFGRKSEEITQPPILAWGVWSVYAKTGDKRFLRYCYPRLRNYLAWDTANRDLDRDGLLEGLVEEDSDVCRCGESGFDNSSMFDYEGAGNSVEFNAFMANDLDYLSRIARELGDESAVTEIESGRDHIASLINDKLWDDEDGFYYDTDLKTGRFRRTRAVTGFLPLLAGIVPQDRLGAMIDRYLINREEFWTPMPLATVPRSEPTYCDDMWRGPVWLNVNYMIAVGLVKSGREDLALEIADRVCAIVERNYGQSGVLYEFYDAEDKKCPRHLARKGYTGIRAISDYHWSGAVYLLFKKRLWRL